RCDGIQERNDLDNRPRQQIAAASDGLQDRLRFVLERGPDVADALHKRVVGNENAGPEGLDQFILRHDPTGVPCEIEKHVEGLGPQWELALGIPTARRVGVELEPVEPQNPPGGCQHRATHAPQTRPKRGGLSPLSALFQRSFPTARGGAAIDFAPGRRLPLDPIRGGDMKIKEVRFRHALPALALFAALAAPARADVIADWNAKAEILAVEKRMLPP